VSHGQIDFQDVLQLVELIKASSNFSEIRLRAGEVEVELRRHGAAALATPPAAHAVKAAPASEPAPALQQAVQSAPALVAKPVASRVPREGTMLVTSPMVGTVYHAPEPGAKPFVSVGQKVSAGDQVCIVEVMKLMNSIPAGCDGVVSEILVADGEPVAFGQALFVIEKQ